MSRIAVSEDIDIEKKEKQREKERLIEEAKWNMFAERWDLAERQLQGARGIAVDLRDKKEIGVILELLKKCEAHQKVELDE
jgi:hypothetical protein